MLVDDNLNELNVIEEQIFESRFSTKTLSLTIAPTMSCNMNCPYCYERDATKEAEMDKKTIENLIDFVNKQSNHLSSFDVTWYGGEPLLEMNTIENLSSSFIKICEKNNVEYNAGIITNGYLLNRNTLEKLKSLNINFIQISLDGDEEYHNKTRCLKNGEGSFKQIIKNLETFKNIYEDKKCGYPNISLRVNVTRQNKNSVKNLLSELERKEILKYATLYFAKIFDYDDPYEKVLKDSEFDDYKNNYINQFEELKNKKEVDLFYYPRRLTNTCTCDLKNSFIIDPRGNLYKCWEEIGQDNNIIGNINSGLKANKPKDYYNYLLFNPLANKKCRNCNILPLCMGGECPLRRVKSNDIGCDERKEKFLKNMYLTFEKLGIENVRTFKLDIN